MPPQSLAPRPQRTLAQAVAVDGFGYWSGEDVRVEFRPAELGTGRVFVRSDLPGAPRIPAWVECRAEVPRRTVLRRGTAAVEMVEHALAALAGLGVDNCEIVVDRPELPGLDGSALAFVDALRSAGIVEQEASASRLVVRRPVRVGTEREWVEASPADDGLTIQYRLDYGHGPIGRQSLTLPITPRTFGEELASARTFLLESEAELLRAQGLGQRVGSSDLLVFGAAGPIDNELRFSDECVRHKTLDVVGDLALAGCELVGRVTAYRSGHRLNAELVRRLLAGHALLLDAESARTRERGAP